MPILSARWHFTYSVKDNSSHLRPKIYPKWPKSRMFRAAILSLGFLVTVGLVESGCAGGCSSQACALHVRYGRTYTNWDRFAAAATIFNAGPAHILHPAKFSRDSRRSTITENIIGVNNAFAMATLRKSLLAKRSMTRSVAL
jgi:hypothetical protein